MTVNISAWLRVALPQLPGAVRSVVRTELLAAIKEFYEKSSALRETVTRNVVANVSAYAITPDTTNCLVLQLLQAAYNKKEIGILTRKPFDLHDPGTPVAWYRSGHNILNLVPAPEAALTEGLQVYLTMRPDPTIDQTVPDVTHEEHFDAILSGLLGRMMQQPSKPYTNLQLAQYHLKRFKAQIAQYKGLANKGSVPAGAGWTFNKFGK